MDPNLRLDVYHPSPRSTFGPEVVGLQWVPGVIGMVLQEMVQANQANFAQLQGLEGRLAHSLNEGVNQAITEIGNNVVHLRGTTEQLIQERERSQEGTVTWTEKQ